MVLTYTPIAASSRTMCRAVRGRPGLRPPVPRRMLVSLHFLPFIACNFLADRDPPQRVASEVRVQSLAGRAALRAHAAERRLLAHERPSAAEMLGQRRKETAMRCAPSLLLLLSGTKTLIFDRLQQATLRFWSAEPIPSRTGAPQSAVRFFRARTSPAVADARTARPFRRAARRSVTSSMRTRR